MSTFTPDQESWLQFRNFNGMSAGLYADGLLVACSIRGGGEQYICQPGVRYDLLFFEGLPPIHGLVIHDDYELSFAECLYEE